MTKIEQQCHTHLMLEMVRIYIPARPVFGFGEKKKSNQAIIMYIMVKKKKKKKKRSTCDFENHQQ